VRAGGDLIVKVDGRRIRTPDDVANAIASKQPGDQVHVEYFRGSDRRSADVKLGERPNQLANDTGQSGPNGGGDVQP
jgi:S1-C subfamily serine protease